MTKEPLYIFFCVTCRKEVIGKQKDDVCPVCGTSLVKEAT